MNLGIKFNNIHSYDDLNLFLVKDGVYIAPATPKTNYVDITGGDGSIDLTEALGEVKYDDRSCKFTFTIGGLTDSEFEAKKTEVSNALNGLACKIVLDKDPTYYYKGRVAVSDYQSDKRVRQIVVTGILNPYKLKTVLTEVAVALTTTTQTLILVNDRKSVVPEITCTGETKIVFNGGTYNLSAGTHKILDVFLKEGDNTLQVSGSGIVTFRYQEGAL